MDDLTEEASAKISFEGLIEGAEDQAKSVPVPFRRTVYLYYLSRYPLSFYRISFGEIPGEVLEDYCYGLDHLMRFLCSSVDVSEDGRHPNVSKMEEYMQHALRGICKDYEVETKRWADKLEKKYGMAVLSLVSDGKFAREWGEMRQAIRVSVREAGRKDSPLGEGASSVDNEIMRLYLLVAYNCRQLVQLGENNQANIDRAVGQHNSIVSEGTNLSVAAQAKRSRFFMICKVILGIIAILATSLKILQNLFQ